jgi:hypothetical protein
MIGEVNWSFWDVAVALVIALASAGWAVNQYYRNRKMLVYEIISNFPIVNVDNKLSSRVKVFFDKKQISNAYISMLLIKNDGGPIPSKDFEGPLVISMGGNARIMASDVIDRFPDDLEVKVSIKDKEVHISPLLLNSNDQILLKLIGTDFDDIKITGRIVGVSEIRSGIRAYTAFDKFLSTLYGISIICLVLSFIASETNNELLIDISKSTIWISGILVTHLTQLKPFWFL